MWVIKNTDAAIGFYAGGSWSTDDAKAKRYPSKDAADAIIRQHRMKAESVQVDTADLDTNDKPQE